MPRKRLTTDELAALVTTVESISYQIETLKALLGDKSSPELAIAVLGMQSGVNVMKRNVPLVYAEELEEMRASVEAKIEKDFPFDFESVFGRKL